MLDTHWLGQVDYLPTYEAMQAWTATRDASTPDQLWICEHPAVFTQGLAGQAAHLLLPGAPHRPSTTIALAGYGVLTVASTMALHNCPPALSFVR